MVSILGQQFGHSHPYKSKDNPSQTEVDNTLRIKTKSPRSNVAHHFVCPLLSMERQIRRIIETDDSKLHAIDEHNEKINPILGEVEEWEFLGRISAFVNILVTIGHMSSLNEFN
uniref:Uncharacterized protein n=1 Tax=Cucumis melo TaxID=3656 RepID=A0A9I9E881_CUCME